MTDTINVINKKISDEEVYKNLKKLHKQYPDIFMSPEDWKKCRLIELKKERQAEIRKYSWSKK